MRFANLLNAVVSGATWLKILGSCWWDLHDKWRKETIRSRPLLLRWNFDERSWKIFCLWYTFCKLDHLDLRCLRLRAILACRQWQFECIDVSCSICARFMYFCSYPWSPDLLFVLERLPLLIWEDALWANIADVSHLRQQEIGIPLGRCKTLEPRDFLECVHELSGRVIAMFRLLGGEELKRCRSTFGTSDCLLAWEGLCIIECQVRSFPLSQEIDGGMSLFDPLVLGLVSSVSIPKKCAMLVWPISSNQGCLRIPSIWYYWAFSQLFTIWELEWCSGIDLPRAMSYPV